MDKARLKVRLWRPSASASERCYELEVSLEGKVLDRLAGTVGPGQGSSRCFVDNVRLYVERGATLEYTDQQSRLLASELGLLPPTAVRSVRPIPKAPSHLLAPTRVADLDAGAAQELGKASLSIATRGALGVDGEEE